MERLGSEVITIITARTIICFRPCRISEDSNIRS